jgi:sulfur carrier protein ThiS
MRVHLGGLLNFFDPQKRTDFEVPLEKETLLADVILKLCLPMGEIAIASVNGEMALPLETVVRNSDKLDLYPPVGGG